MTSTWGQRLRDVTRRPGSDRPALSIVVVATEMSPAVQRCLASLAPTYQQDVDADDYEVVLVDNGATPPLAVGSIAGWGAGLRVARLVGAAPRREAIRAGVRAARGQAVGVVDGDSLASPGLVHYAIAGAGVHPSAAIATFNWDLGYDLVAAAREAGWHEEDEDRLLAAIGWPAEGYELFRVATLDLPAVDTWFSGVAESHAFFLPAHVWARLDAGAATGQDGDAASILSAAAALDDLEWVVLLSEATFRQVSASDDAVPATTPRTPRRRPVVLGAPPSSLPPQLARALEVLLRVGVDAPRGLPETPVDAEARALASGWLHWAQVLTDHGRTADAAAFARRARRAWPGSPDWVPYLRSITRADAIDALPADRRASYYTLAGDVFERLGKPEEATAEFTRALEAEPTNAAAYSGLSRIRMPGPMYDQVLKKVHEELVPATYLEIGVFEGASLSLARPPTVAVAIDPDPTIKVPISIEYHLYPERSSEFFEQHDVRKLLGGGPTLVFIDGLHQFPVVLDDFRHVEAIADPETIVVLHDVMPFDELTQRPERACEFYTGDCWKLLHCLAEARPTLSWFTVPTAPSGLAFVSGLDPSSSVLWDRYDELVERYNPLGFEHAANVPGPVVENRWEAIAAALAALRPVAPRGAAPPVVPIEPNSPEILANRIRAQEDTIAAHERTERELAGQVHQAEEDAAALRRQQVDYEARLHAAHAELEAFRRSRVLNASRTARELFGRVLGRDGPGRR